ncbi:MAG: hypothetical protein R3D88_00660 [Alphaproteobacteria bacterium]|nr:hypothetical protein [Alphaproteobacteria bacterium]
MSLSADMRKAAQGVWSHEDLESLFRRELAPLVLFLEVSNASGTDEEGFSLHASCQFHAQPEMGDKGVVLGRYLNIKAECCGAESSGELLNFKLYETGLVFSQTILGNRKEEFIASGHIGFAMEGVVRGYANISSSVERVRTLAELAAEKYNQHFDKEPAKPQDFSKFSK